MQFRPTLQGVPTPASAKAAKRDRRARIRRNRQMREQHTAYIMTAFGLLLGSVEIFIVLHYI